MKKYAKILCLITALLLIVTLVSCSADSKEDAGTGNYAPSDPYGELSKDDAAGGINNTNTSLVPPDLQGKQGTKVIKTFELSAETTAFEAATTALGELIVAHGGYVESASSNNQSLSSTGKNYRRTASYTLRIPAEQVDAFVSSLGTELHLTSNRSYVEDISETYYSIEATLQELQIERDSLLDILNAPETKKDYDLWLTVQGRLSTVKQQIAVYQGQLNRYDSKVAYSTVNLSVREVLSLTAVSEGNSFGSRLSAAFADGWNGFVEGLQEFLLWLAEALPALVLFALIIGAVIWVLIAANRRAKARRQAAHQAYQAYQATASKQNQQDPKE